MHTHTHSLSLSHTHTHTHTHSLSHTHTHVQYFRREFQASIQGLMQSTRTLLFHPLLIAMRRPGETGRAGQLKKNPNLILHCLELLLPLNSQFLSPEDRDLVEQYRIKFRRVRVCCVCEGG